MSTGEPVDDTTRRGETLHLPQGNLSLIVLGSGLFASHPLPDEGDVSIGRAEGCDVRIDDASISRRHAILHLGTLISIEDLGSANGTRVRDAWIKPQQPVAIAPGEAVELGSIVIVVQSRDGSAGRLRHLWAHGYFEARLEEECARARRKDLQFALVRLRCAATLSSQTVQQALSEALRATDVVGSYGPREYELLLVDAGPDDVDKVIARFLGKLAPPAGEIRVGVACYPRDGREPHALVGRACQKLRDEPEASAPETRVDTMQSLQAVIKRIAAGTISVLIQGETGVGKEVFAERVHGLSPRAGKPFLRLNCAALTESILESELFGHERGAFTSADKVKPGLLETADTGTVFLDEIGELPMSTQVKLLRVIEERQVMRVGALAARAIDVRFIAATNRELEQEIGRGRFRQDLYFRLNGFSLHIPPLRERTGEIEGLARTFAAQAAKQLGRTEPRLSREALDLLLRYRWPGNIRELRNMMERAVLLCLGDVIMLEHLPVERMVAALTRGPVAAGVAAPAAPSVMDPKQRAEHDRIQEALARCAGNQTQAAKLLGISRRTLVNRLDAYGMARPRKGRDGE